MRVAQFVVCIALAGFFGSSHAASPGIDSSDPLVAVDLNRAAIVADIVAGFRSEVANANAGREEEGLAELRAQLNGLRADRLLAASLASSYSGLQSVLRESQSATLTRTQQKALGDPGRDLIYTPLTPCRLIDTRGFGAPFQGGPFAPNERRPYVPNGACSIPTSGVASMLISFTTQNLTPNSGGYLAILAPAAPVSTTVDVFNLGATWSASNTAVATGTAGQFDIFVSTANAQVVVDILGYFSAPSAAAGTVTSVATGTGLTGGPITTTGTIGIAANGVGTAQIADAAVTAAKLAANGCTSGQVLKYNGAAWACAVDNDTNSGGTVTNIATSAGLTGGPITSTGTIGLAATQLLPTVACASGQFPEWGGSAWICVTDLTLSSSSSLFIGVNAGNAGTLITGGGNTGIGPSALQHNTTGAQNTAIGQQALVANTSGGANTAMGWQALAGNTTGASNTASGMFALGSNTTGGNNVAAGFDALLSNTTASDNTAIGTNALRSNTNANKNTAVGSGALYTQSFALGAPWDSLNTAVGYQALYSNQPPSAVFGVNNTAVGANALSNNTQGHENTALGWVALSSNTNGWNNTAVGANALQSNTSGGNNIAIGGGAGFNNTTGGGNIAIGFNAGGATTGGNNIALGGFAGGNLTTGSYNIDIGQVGVAAESGTIRIGTAGLQTMAFISGIRGVTTGALDAVAVLIDSNGQLGTVSSSRRFKDDIADMEAASSALMKLRPVTFHYKADQNPQGRRLQYGLIAEEVAEIYPGLIAHSADGQVETVMYQFLPSMLLNEYQKQQRVIEAQAAEVTRQSAELARQRQIIAELEQDRRLQNARMDVLEKNSIEQTAHMAKLLDRLQRMDFVTAGVR